MWVVTRQSYSSLGEDALVVEVAGGGRNYSNPGMLVPKFNGEGAEYADPREAAKVAVEIAKAWRGNGSENITIRYGHTGGNTIPFDEPENVADMGEAEITAWGEEAYEKCEKCDRCGDVLPPKGKRFVADNVEDAEFCSLNCANEAADAWENDQRELQVEEWKEQIATIERPKLIAIIENIMHEDVAEDATMENLHNRVLQGVKDDEVDEKYLDD